MTTENTTTRTRKPLTAEQKEVRNARRRKANKEARSKAEMIAKNRLAQLALARENLAKARAAAKAAGDLTKVSA